MATLQELKKQIENANALGIKNLADKGVGFAGLFPPTTYEIMQGIADIIRDGGNDSGDSIEENNNTLLLHCDDFTDSGKYTHNLINNGVSIGSTVKKFGNGSMFFNANTDYVEVDKTNFNFADNDFTIDFWAYPTAFTGMIIDSWGGETTSSFAILTSTGGELRFAYSKEGTSGQTVISTNKFLKSNEWQHIAITRSNNTLYFFINGVLVYHTSFTYTLKTPTNNIWIGKNVDTAYPNDRYSGYLDEIRIINGVCEWVEDFIPPTEPYSVGAISELDALEDLINNSGVLEDTEGTVTEKVEELIDKAKNGVSASIDENGIVTFGGNTSVDENGIVSL